MKRKHSKQKEMASKVEIICAEDHLFSKYIANYHTFILQRNSERKKDHPSSDMEKEGCALHSAAPRG